MVAELDEGVERAGQWRGELQWREVPPASGRGLRRDDGVRRAQLLRIRAEEAGRRTEPVVADSRVTVLDGAPGADADAERLRGLAQGEAGGAPSRPPSASRSSRSSLDV
nr:hypothetical protein [Parafrankia soli]